MLALATLLGALFAATAGGDPPPRPAAFDLTVKANVLARGNHVTIGELADITPVSADALAIGQLRFGPAPVPGFTRSVTRTELLQALVGAGHAAGSFAFRGASEAIVQTVAVEVSPADLTEAATTVLQAVLAREGGDVEWEPGNRVRSVQAPPGRQSRELRARVRGGATQPASAVVDVEVLVDGEVARTVAVPFKLTRFRPVLKVSATIAAGAPLGADNLVLSREPLHASQGLYLSSLDQAAGMIARRNLQPGKLLALSDVGAPALIHRGEIVTVVLTRGRVKVTARALANHDAALGEPVALTNLQSRAQLTGIAAAPGTVVVPTGN